MAVVTQTTNTGNGIAHGMIGSGAFGLIVGALIWYFAGSTSADSPLTVMAIAAAVMQLGVVVVILGLHALAAPAPRT